jgi:hypothetical protein
MEENWNAYTKFVWKAERKRQLRNPRRCWADIIKMNLREEGVVWIRFILLRIGTGGGLF